MTNKSDVRTTELRTEYLFNVYFNSVIKRVKQCCCTLILLPKSTLNANLTTTNRFYTNDDWQHGRFENFESDHQYESNLVLYVRFKIESNHEASQVPTIVVHSLNVPGFFTVLWNATSILWRSSRMTARHVRLGRVCHVWSLPVRCSVIRHSSVNTAERGIWPHTTSLLFCTVSVKGGWLVIK